MPVSTLYTYRGVIFNTTSNEYNYIILLFVHNLSLESRVPKEIQYPYIMWEHCIKMVLNLILQDKGKEVNRYC